MPRESVHFYVASRVYESLRISWVDFELFLIGSTLHDSFYYLRGGGSEFERIALFLHGTEGEDTLSPISNLWRKLDREQNRIVGSCLLGMLTHVAVDSTFHPMIYFLTGNYFDPNFVKCSEAQSRHRRLEAKIDKWIQGRDYDGKITLRKLVGAKREDLTQAIVSLRELGPTDFHATSKDWIEAINTHAIVDGLSRSRLFAPLIKAGALIVPKLKVLEDCIVSDGELDLPSTFSNPVTNVSEELDLDLLLERSVRQSLGYISTLLKDGYLENGPSLNFGLVGRSVGEASYFGPSTSASRP